MGLKNFEDVVHAWVTLATSKTAIWENTGGKRLPSEFVSMTVLESSAKGVDYVDNSTDDSGGVKISSHRGYRVRFTAHGGKTAMDICERMNRSLSKPTTQEYFDEFNVAIVDATPPVISPTLVDGANWEELASFEARFNTVVVETDSVGFFDTVVYSGSVKSGNREIEIKEQEVTS